MKIYTLTTQQKETIHGSYYSDVQFFNCVQDISDNWFLFLSDDDINIIKNGEFAYILDFTEGEFTPKPNNNQLTINNPI